MSKKRGGPTPPRAAEWLLERCVPPGQAGQSMVGDAREEFQAQVHSGSRVPAAIWYWFHILPIAFHSVFMGLESEAGTLPLALSCLARDLRMATRTLVRRPGFAVAVVGTLGIGIGGVTVAFSMVNGVLLDPLPYEEPDQIVGVFRIRADWMNGAPPAGLVYGSYAVPPATFRDWRQGARSFTQMGAFELISFTYSSGDRPLRLSGSYATSGVFKALGVEPVLGRLFLPEEERVGGPRLALISHGFWDRELGSDPGVLGRQLSLNGTPYAVVGVMPEGFSFPSEGMDVWATSPDDRVGFPARNTGFLQVVGRLRDGVTLGEAQRGISDLQTRLAEVNPDERERTARLYSWKDLQVAATRPGIHLLLGATVLVLLIASANITNLLLVRALERHRELAIRSALGGGRFHLTVQLLSEGLTLALAGGVAGCLVAAWALDPVLAALPISIPNADAIRIDPAVLGFAALVSVAIGLLTGALPAFRMMRKPPGSALRDGGRGIARGRNRSQTALAIGEITMAFALLAGAGLFLKSFQGMTTADLGFEPTNRLIMRFSLPGQYREDPEAIAQFFRELTERLSLRPDVAAAGTASQMPFSGGTSFPPASIEATGEIIKANVHNSVVTPRYFEALGLRLVAGRLLSDDDGAGAPPVTVVNRSLARRYWPGEDPLGRRIRLDLPGDSVWRTVVGVVGDLRYSLGPPPFPEYYSTVAQRPLWYQTVVVHATRNHAGVAEAMRETLWSMEPNTPVTVVSLEDRIRDSRGWVSARFGSLAMGTLATLAALLSVIGVYGVVAFTVRVRTHEFGVRMALGESRPQLLRWVLSRGLVLALAGVVLGLGAVLATGRFVDQFLFQVNARDPSTLLAVALLLVGTGLGASAIPALRATRVDPVRTLTSE